MKTKRIVMALAGMVGTMAQAAPPGLLAPVAVEDLPARRVAYVEQIGNFQNNPGIYDILLQKLLDWALPAKLWDFPAKTLIACIYPDDPASTPPGQQRLWFGITIPADAVPPAGIQVLTLPAGPHAVGRFAIPSDQFGAAWGYLYGEWIPKSSHAPAGLAYELQKNDSSEDPEQKHLVDICIPVQKLPAP
ncbi:MAG TPA: GyrI-like domain-containing protein [Kiritimatiellia bacterium]|nr:GyrI-like domain-containing protein [Kiritimatiellia bacterium]